MEYGPYVGGGLHIPVDQLAADAVGVHANNITALMMPRNPLSFVFIQTPL
jgi:hypothetical protein